MRTLTTRQARQMAAQRKRYGAGSGRPPGALSDKPRCPCGVMTRDRARKRRHVCEAVAVG